MMQPSPSSERLAPVDATRALAALLVVWIHAAETLVEIAGSGGWLYPLARDLNVGSIGVTAFFLVSGFVIPASLREGRPRGDELRVFAIRRFFRLYPVFWLSMLLAVVVMWWGFGKAVEWPMVLANATMAARPLGFELLQLPYWTLFVELVFYILCALLFAFGLLQRAGMLLTLSLLLAAMHLAGYAPAVRQSWLQFLLQDTLAQNLSLMLAGALLRRWQDGALGSRPIRAALVGLLALWFYLPLDAGMSFASGEAGWAYPPTEGSKALGIGLFLVMVFAVRPNGPVLAALGRASYSLYLFHSIVAFGLLWLAMQPGFVWLRGWDLAAYIGLCAALSIILAALAYRFVELPAMALGRRLSRSRRGFSGAPQASASG